MTSIFTNHATKLLGSRTLRAIIPAIRYKSGRGCNSTAPRCSPEELARTKCMQEKKGEIPTAKPYRGMWENPDCCLDPCKKEFPRFDELYYAPSDKQNRKYTRTWDECPSLKVKSKRKCFIENLNLAPIERRPRRVRPKQIQCKPPELMDCCKGPRGICPHISLPGCKAPKKPHTCVGAKRPTGCKKLCAPYPSYSECVLPEFRPVPPRECSCVMGVTMCDIWNLIRAGKLDFKKKFKHD